MFVCAWFWFALLYSSSASDTIPPLPWIHPAVDAKQGVWKTEHDVQFFPRGADYIRLNGSQGKPPHIHPVYHSTFSPKLVNTSWDDHALKLMASLQYNIARVFIDIGTKHRADGVNGKFHSHSTNDHALSSAYMDNVAQFMRQATKHQIYIMITLPGIPENKYFHDLVTNPPPNKIGGQNVLYLHGAHVHAKGVYLSVFHRELKKRLGNLISAVFAYSMDNEMAYVLDAAPFNWNNGTVTTGDGKTYSMSNATSRQSCADNNLKFYVDAVAHTFRNTHMDAPFLPQVTIGMFTYGAVDKNFTSGMLYPHSSDPRVPPRPEFLSNVPALSYIDVHVYPHNITTWRFSKDIASEGGWDAKVMNVSKPILMAEYGAFHKFFPNITTIPKYFKHMMAQSCQLHPPVGGWMFWTWDTWEQPRLWNLWEDGLFLAKALSPAHFPHPCE